MALFTVSAGVVQKLTNDCYWIASQVGFPLSFPVTYYQSDGTTPENLTGVAIELHIFAGYLTGFTGSPLLTFDQSSQSHGQIVITAASGLAVFTLTAAGSAALVKGDYSYRWVRKVGGVNQARTFYGRWRQRP